MGIELHLDPGFERDLYLGPEMGDVLEHYGKAVRSRASKLFPDDPSTSGKDLHSNITVDLGVHGGRKVARVNANDFKAGWYEFGTSRTTGVHALSRALEENVGPVEPGSDDG